MRKITATSELLDLCREILELGENTSKIQLKALIKEAERCLYGDFCIRTMSVAELNRDLHDKGMTTTPEKIRAMILHGQYPFAVGYRDKSTECEIYTKKYHEWLKEVGDSVG